MSISQEELTASLSEVLGGAPSSEEGLDYARRILQQYMMAPPEDEFDPLGGMREQEESVKGALEMARKRIEDMQGPSRGEKLLALSAGFGAPTRTGAFGETAANVAAQLQPIAQEQRALREKKAAGLSELDLAMAQAGGPLTQAEFDLYKLQFEQEGRMAQEALKTIARGTSSGSASGKTREAKIQDLMTLWGMSRRDASALVDRFVKVEIVPQTGRARLINEIEQSVNEVPLGVLETAGYNIETGLPVEPQSKAVNGAASTTVPPGEIDTRTQQEKDAQLYAGQVFEEGASVYDMTKLGTGPMSKIREVVSIPSSLIGGPVATETLIARQGLKLHSRDLAQSLVDNPKMPVRLVEMALDAAGIEPGVLDTGTMMEARLIELDRYLYQKYLEWRRIADSPNEPETDRSDAATNVAAIGKFLRDLGVPQELQRRTIFKPQDPPGADFDLPELPSSAPPGSGYSDVAWAALTSEEKARVVYLLQQQQSLTEEE